MYTPADLESARREATVEAALQEAITALPAMTAMQNASSPDEPPANGTYINPSQPGVGGGGDGTGDLADFEWREYWVAGSPVGSAPVGP